MVDNVIFTGARAAANGVHSVEGDEMVMTNSGGRKKNSKLRIIRAQAAERGRLSSEQKSNELLDAD